MEQEHPDFLWRTPDPERAYEAVIVGGGSRDRKLLVPPASLAALAAAEILENLAKPPDPQPDPDPNPDRDRDRDRMV